MSEKSEIVTIDTVGDLSPGVIFKEGGIKPVLDAIKNEVSSEVPDTSSDKGRKAIASTAYKVSQSKSLLEKMGKQLADDLNAQLKPINAERKLARETLDALRDEIRKPLTDWEEAQKARKAEEDAKVEAAKLAEKVAQDHEIALLLNEKFDRDAADLAAQEERDRQAAAESARKEAEQREAKIKKEAEENARLEAERAAKAEIERVEREKQEAIHREAEAERQRIAAEERAKAQAEMAEKQRVAAIKKAENDKRQAIENERKRQEAEKAAEAKAIEEREANKRHVGDIRRVAKEALMASCDIDEQSAKKIILAINNNLIPAVKINY